MHWSSAEHSPPFATESTAGVELRASTPRGASSVALRASALARDGHAGARAGAPRAADASARKEKADAGRRTPSGTRDAPDNHSAGGSPPAGRFAATSAKKRAMETRGAPAIVKKWSKQTKKGRGEREARLRSL